MPHECKFGLAETGKVFQKTINELTEFSAYRAGLGWAALARYAANLLAQPWRKEYKVIRVSSRLALALDITLISACLIDWRPERCVWADWIRKTRIRYCDGTFRPAAIY